MFIYLFSEPFKFFVPLCHLCYDYRGSQKDCHARMEHSLAMTHGIRLLYFFYGKKFDLLFLVFNFLTKDFDLHCLLFIVHCQLLMAIC